jgi:hypothetical protein
MKSSTLLVLSSLFVVNSAAVGSLRGGSDAEQDRELLLIGKDFDITSGYEFDSSIEITLELVEGSKRVRNLKNTDNTGQQNKIEQIIDECEGSSDPDECEDKVDLDLEDPNDPAALDALDNVQGMALGLNALQAFARSVKRKITKDNNLMAGVEAENCTVSLQEIINVEAEIANGRRLAWGGNYVRMYTTFQGRCPHSTCGYDDNDGRRELQERAAADEDDTAAIEACSQLAKKIMNAAGRRAELLSNIQRIGLTMIIPKRLTEVKCWFPTAPWE